MRRNESKWICALGMLVMILTLVSAPAGFAQKTKPKSTATKSAAKESAPAGPVDINSATEKQLEDLPGVGASTAKKIVAGRPYSSVSDLTKAGISKATITKITPLVTVGGAGAAAVSTPTPAPSKRAATRETAAEKTSTPTGPVDINSASEKQLEDLPGVGPSTAKKIVGGRPYASVNDLTKAGISKATITKITPLVTVGGAAASTATPTPAASKRAAAREAAAEKTSAPTGPLDINSASEKQLEDLPGVGPATAKKIIGGRPYASVNDLTKAGVSKATIAKITPLVSVGSAPAAALPNPSPTVRRTTAAAPVAAPPVAAPATSPSAAATAAEAPAAYTPPPAQGMVWVNLPTKVYHKAGDRWYGKTKNGKYMSEADAIQAGYRLAK